MDQTYLARLNMRITGINKTINETKEIIRLSETTGCELKTICKLQFMLRNDIDKLNSEFKSYLSTNPTTTPGYINEITNLEMEAENLLGELVSIEKTSSVQTVTGLAHSNIANTKLPKLTLPTFNGEILKWHQFWDRFESTIHTSNLAEADKLSYLIGCLEGPALEKLNGLSITNINYNIAISTLKEKYGSISELIDSHYDALFKMKKASDSPLECRRTLDEFEKHMRILEKLGEDINGNQFRASIMKKFPDNIIYQVKLTTDKDAKTPKFLESLDTVISAYEKTTTVKASVEPGSTAALHVASSKSTKINFRKRKLETRIHGKPKSDKTPAKKQKLTCIFCEGGHYNDICENVKSREERIKKLSGRCFLCFRKGHTASECRLKRKCVYCKKDHNRALCPTKLPAATVANTGENIRETMSKSPTLNNLSNCTSYLQTATAQVSNRHCRVLLDCGSQRSYITTKTVEQLGLIPDGEDLLIIYTFGTNQPKETTSPSLEIKIMTKRNIERIIKVNVVPYITDRIPVPTITIPKEVDIMADDGSAGEGVELLIGNDYYFSFFRNEDMIHIHDYLYLINTDFGWIVSGKETSKEESNILSVITYCQCHDMNCPYFTEPDLPLRNIDMKFLWSLESIGITDSPKATQQEEAVKQYNDTVKYECGRYYVKWPWVQYPPNIPINYGLAFGRLKSLLHRLDDDSLKDYIEILKEQLDAGVIEIVDPPSSYHKQTSPPLHYLPHHMVKQEGKRGRVVYDASAKIRDQKSLNEAMYKGPSMLEDLTGLLIKFRCGKIGITGDVEKAFLQIGLQNEDRDVTRFLWVKDPKQLPTEENLLHLRFCRVPFGIISSPFLLTATIRHHFSKRNELLLKRTADRCYVDNLVTNAETVEEAKDLYNETRNMFTELSMNIRDWASNSQEFLDTIPEECKSKQKETIKLLGLTWNLKEDTLVLKIKDNTFEEGTIKDVTKRTVLKTLARLYDPCGFAAPLILPAKLLFQELCTQKIKWDSRLSQDTLTRWHKALECLRAAKEIEVPRYIGIANSKSNSDTYYDLHCFTDASKNAYAAVIYLLVCDKRDRKTSFIMSKARITPVEDKNELKIPRLELLGYLIGSRLLKYVQANLDLNIEHQYLWTDSLIVLSWMRSNKLLPPFVNRRVNEIKQNGGVEYRYVNTSTNPADLATRPELWYQKNHLWFNGPEFLKKGKEDWPKSKHTEEQAAFVSLGEALNTVDGPEMVTKGYEAYEDLSTALIPPHTITDQEDQVCSVEPVNQTPITPQTSQEDSCCQTEPSYGSSDSESISVIKELQAKYFPDEVAGKVTHLTRNLGLFTDIDGILRCRGRMMHANWSYEKKYPALIPKDSPFTNELIKRSHETNYHVGVQHTLSIIRQKFWIPHGRTQVQKVIRRCPQCTKHGGGPYRLPPAPALPIERVNYSPAFTYTGMDFLGPIFVATKDGKEKRWVCLLTCLAVRAVHLEVVDDMSAEECLLALRRFIAVRGLPRMIVSDNAQTFKLTSEVLTGSYCTQNKIKWKFIPQLAPWHGGFYERLVALVKHCLKRSLEKHLLYDNQLKTVMKEVECVINTRPLTYVGAELDTILRPVDFLNLGECLELHFSEMEITEGTNTKVDLVEGWKRGQRILKEFQKMFVDQYLSSLRERFKHSPKQQRVTADKIPEIGDVVQIKDNSKNRNNWKVGKITALLEGEDGACRVAKVKVGDTEFTRSIGHLYPLESDLSAVDPTLPMKQLPPLIEVCNERDKGSSEHKVMDDRTELPKADNHPYSATEEAYVNEHGVSMMQELSVPEENVQLDQPLDSFIEPADEQLEVQEITHEQNEESVQEECSSFDKRVKRGAAVRARERIAEWTSQLFAYLEC